MKIIKQKSKLWGECPSDFKKAIEWIERAGRVCYRSEDKIVEGSGITFVNNIIKRKHLSVIEHSNFCIRNKERGKHPIMKLISEKSIFDSPFFNFCIYRDRVYISGNWRTWFEWYNRNNPNETISKLDDFIYGMMPLDNYEIVQNEDIPNEIKMVTVEFVTDRAVTHELVRHRPASYSQESQRYVRYDGNMMFVQPAFHGTCSYEAIIAWKEAMEYAEKQYILLRKEGMKAEDARTVLPNSTATKIVMTASIPEWKHVFNLRLTPAAYPQIRNLLQPIYKKMVKNEWLISTS